MAAPIWLGGCVSSLLHRRLCHLNLLNNKLVITSVKVKHADQVGMFSSVNVSQKSQFFVPFCLSCWFQ
jgi:hypothetical protein